MSRSGHCRNNSTTIGSTSQPASVNSQPISRSGSASRRASFIGPAPRRRRPIYRFSRPVSRANQPGLGGRTRSFLDRPGRAPLLAPTSMEQPVHAGSDGVDVLIRATLLVRAGEEVLLGKIEVQVFGLEGQVRHCRHLDAAAGGKTGHQATIVERSRRAVVITLGARGDDDVRLCIGPGEAGAFPEAAEGVDLEGDRSLGAALARIAANQRGGAFDVAERHVALDSEHQGTPELIIHSRLNPAEAAMLVDMQVGPGGARPRVSAVRTDIKAG